MVKRLLFLSLISGLIVALWGLPSHFGYDPTCLVFRGSLNISCWTQDFIPTIRIFSMLGQPDWLAAYLAILIPIAIAFAIKNSKSEAPNPKQAQNSNNKNSKRFGYSDFKNLNLFRISIFGLLILFYVDLLYTRARSGFLGLWLALIVFGTSYWWLNGKPKLSLSWSRLKSPFVMVILGLLVITFLIGTPVTQLHKFTLPGIKEHFQQIKTAKPTAPTTNQNESQTNTNNGGTESGNIRLFVWEGAINTWKANPIFGTGVETFAFAYYKYKPAGQNLTSEWNFLYNKAHNEYLNYLATTGIFGLGTYLGIIAFFLMTVILRLKAEGSEIRSAQNNILIIALLASYFSILITDFFGFSVVITNIYLFMIPAFVFVLSQQIKLKTEIVQVGKSSVGQWTALFFIVAIGAFMLISLFRFWLADIAFALGYNLDRAGEYQQAYPNLHKAVELRGDEPVFKDELSLNDAIIATALVAQKSRAAGIASGDARQDENTKQQTVGIASSLAQEAINVSNEVVSQYSNNVVFWKTRVRLFHTLSQVDSRYLSRAMDAIEKASLLAPNDANISYNLGVLYGQNNNLTKGIETLEKTIQLKPDYREAHYALGLFYHTASLDKSSTDSVLDKSGKVVVNEALNKKAIEQMQYILANLSPKDAEAQKSIADWTK